MLESKKIHDLKEPLQIAKQDIEHLVVSDGAHPLILNQNHANEKPLVLIADDNADVRAYIASCLATDYRLDIAKEGQECENIAFEKTIDWILKSGCPKMEKHLFL